MTDPKQRLRSYATIGLISLALFTILTLCVVFWTDQVSRFDTWFGTRPQSWAVSHDWLASGARRLGFATEWKPMTVICVLAEIILLIRGYYRATLYMVLAMSGMGAAMFGLKDLIARPRPVWETPVHVMTDYSYPSGHALTAMTISTIIVILSTHLLRRGMPRWVPYVLTVYVVVIAADRIILGVHNLTDVVGGALLGLSFGTLAAVIVNVTKCKPRAEKEKASAQA